MVRSVFLGRLPVAGLIAWGMRRQSALCRQISRHADNVTGCGGQQGALRHRNHAAPVPAAQAEYQGVALRAAAGKGQFHLVAVLFKRGRRQDTGKQALHKPGVQAADAAHGIKGDAALPLQLHIVRHGLQRASATVAVVGTGGRCRARGILQDFQHFGFTEAGFAAGDARTHGLPGQAAGHKNNSATVAGAPGGPTARRSGAGYGSRVAVGAGQAATVMGQAFYLKGNGIVHRRKT